MKNNSFYEIYDKLKTSKKVLLSLHTSPDGDSLGSCCAIKHFLERDFNSEVKIISYDRLSRNLMDLDMSKDVEFGTDIKDINFSEYDLFIILDVSIPDRIGKQKYGFEFKKNIFSINIDHHVFEEQFTDMVYIDEKAVSTCSIILEFFKKTGVKIDKKIADSLLLGVLTDSNFLTSDRAIIAIKEINYLIDKGGDYLYFINNIKLKTSMNMKKYYALHMNNIKINNNKKFAYSLLSWENIKDLNLNISDIRLGIYAINDLEDTDFVFNLVEFKDEIKISFRSSQSVDVSRFAKALGGGGHKAASGVNFSGISLHEAEKKVLKVIDKLGVKKFSY